MRLHSAIIAALLNHALNGPVRYQPFYCEENAWHLAAALEVRLAPVRVIVIAGLGEHTALWQQRASRRPDGLVLWDYHVICAAADRIFDPDSRLGLDIAATTYFDATFQPLVEGCQPRFRVLSAAEYRAQLATDRRHMRDASGGYLQPPPPWPLIGEGHTLPILLDMSRPSPGNVVALNDLYTLLQGPDSRFEP